MAVWSATRRVAWRIVKAAGLWLLRFSRLLVPMSSLRGVVYQSIFPPQTLTFNRRSGTGYLTMEPHTAQVPGLGVTMLPNTRVVGNRRVLFTAKNRLIDNCLLPKGNEIVAISSPPVRLPGTTCMIMDEVGNLNYYHFLIETLPKMELVDRSKLAVDRYLAPMDEDYQRDAYRLAGIAAKVVAVTPRSHFLCDRLIVPDVLMHNGFILNGPHFSAMQASYELPWVADFLNKRLSLSNGNKIKVADGKPAPKKFFVSRARARSRRILNQDAFRTLLARYGIVEIALEDYALAEKIALFRDASFIITPFGAALTNIVFCSPGAIVVELAANDLPSKFFWMLSEKIDIEYLYLREESPFDGVSDFNLVVNIEELDALLASVLPAPGSVS